MSSHTLIFRAHSSSRYSVAALLGAVEIDSRLSDLTILAPVETSHSLIQKHLEGSHVIIAHSVMSTQLDRVREEINTLREQFGSTVTLIAGGPHASTRPIDLVELGFDYIVIGEGEHVFPELLLTLMNEKDPETISGIVTKYTETIPLPKDLPKITLDEYPPFALGMNVVGPIEVTRGCPYSCKFCSTPFLTGSRVRHRSVKTIVHWLRRAVEKRGFKRTWFLSPNALCYGGRGRTVERDRLEDLLIQATSIEGLDDVFYGSFPSEIRPEFATKDNLDLFRHYVANKTIQIGLQSGSDRVLELANRHHTVSQGMDAVNIALECGFVPHVDMIFGLPGEEEKELGVSLELCYELAEMGARVHGHVFMPLPGSAYENMPPGHLDDESRRVLGELSRKKLLTGSWSNQEQLAERLALKRK
ncbi:MAG: TIGR04013 family B12-binding domain/radical SAM domain-containing protein [Candidatus Thorarchaeota archaeon]